MAHFAELDENNLVLRIIVVSDQDTVGQDGSQQESVGIAFCQKLFGGKWKQTFYESGQDKNWARIGDFYDESRNAFIPPKPYNSWVLEEETCRWKAPVDMPADAGTGEPTKRYTWDESTISWKPME